MILLTILLLCANNSWAQNPSAHPTRYSTNAHGMLGLNTIPTARMDEAGTARIHWSGTDPYMHGALGFQIADPLYISVRQSAEISTFDADPIALYPGLDFKLRLLKENERRPAVVLGMQSAIGHKRMSGEYIAASKRVKDFDITAGLGWGYFAGAAHIDNPLKAFGSHFDQNRDIDGESPARAADWFTGEKIGFFGGIEYFPSFNPLLKGLSLKADIGANRYEAERAAFNFDAPPPWSLGINYKPPRLPFADFSLAAQGTDRFMGRISFQTNLKTLNHRNTHDTPQSFLRPYRSDFAAPEWARLSAEKDNTAIINTVMENRTATTTLLTRPHRSSPQQFSNAAMHIANHAGQNIESITITPQRYGLIGPSLTLMRHDLETALAHNTGSAEEIWHNAEITQTLSGLQKPKALPDQLKRFRHLTLTLQNQIGLSEEDDGFLFRNAAIIDADGPQFGDYIHTAMGLRLNLAENLHKLDKIRPERLTPIRSDIDDFADRLIALEKLYGAFTHTIAPDLHIMTTAGYLEEMYAGAGGEILYRPFDKRFAIGAESWLAMKRDPDTTLNLGLAGINTVTAHANAWYDLPEWDTTLGVKVGRFLAEDLGASISLTKNFKNGAYLATHFTMTDQSEPDLFGGDVHYDHGIKLTIPLGGYLGRIKSAPNTNFELITAPFGRDIAQSLNNPLSLYELTAPFSKSHIIRHWDEITE